jgi:outer membrane lipoprotein-sorting protein
MLRGILSLAFCMSLVCAQPVLAQTKDEAALNQVLKQMEAVGRTFRSFEAHITKRKYTAVLQEFDTPEKGEFYYARAKDGSALLRQEITSPGPSILTIKGSILTFYQPVLKQAQVVNLGKNRDKAEYLALGLGQSPGKLRETFDISYQGTESINGTPCSVLVLKPKNPSAAAYFSIITLWIKKATGVPIQQKLQEPAGDYLLVDFTDEKLNVDIPGSMFEQKLPAGVEVQRIR